MKFDELLDIVPDNGVFTTGQLLAGVSRPNDLRRQLARWIDSGKIWRLRRGVYLVRPPYAKVSAHPFVLANVLQRASYVSLQSALSHYGMIPEYVPLTTSVGNGRPEELTTPVGRFLFRHISKHRFGGFSEQQLVDGQTARIASPHKALLDLLYLTPNSDSLDYLRELRITPPEGFDENKLLGLAAETQPAKVQRGARRLLSLWKEF